jgi:mono/diheme cytochrome c family protein
MQPKTFFLRGALMLCGGLLAGCKHPLSADEMQGMNLYTTHCADCHEQTHEGLLKTPPRLNGIFRAQTLPDGVPVSDEAIHDVIRDGLRTMPAFNGRLNDKEIAQLLAYLHTKQ